MGDGLKAAKSAAIGPTPAQLRALKEAVRNYLGRLYLGGSGRQQMLQRMVRAGWGRIEGRVFVINDAGRALAAKDG